AGGWGRTPVGRHGSVAKNRSLRSPLASRAHARLLHVTKARRERDDPRASTFRRARSRYYRDMATLPHAIGLALALAVLAPGGAAIALGGRGSHGGTTVHACAARKDGALRLARASRCTK